MSVGFCDVYDYSQGSKAYIEKIWEVSQNLVTSQHACNLFLYIWIEYPALTNKKNKMKLIQNATKSKELSKSKELPLVCW